ncbi:MAG: hypothetical protein BXU00_00595 [Candidatus Nanoclepta minutus]|uniref:Uncharacterized protein n=1 Tax=Candidatus Nanoclepta minutus TaxID=1940235 RepID=A0A397WNE1_9ARCH|nr:MAG: hypothetical protein BXU00_00595 [Candidatus Nanoclepta minutus]
MINKKMLIYLFIIAFFLSFNKYDTLLIGIYNLLFSFLSSIISYLLILYVYRIVSFYYGILPDFSLIEIEKEIKKYDYFKKEIVTSKKTVNLSYLLTLLFGFLSSGYAIPILLSLNTIIIESRRIGKSKNIDVSFEEKTKIIFLGTLITWIIFSIIKYLSSLSLIIEGILEYMFKFLLYYTITSILPICFFLIPLISEKMKYSFKSISIGDNFIYTKNPFLIASSITLLFLPFLSIFLNPILVIILSLITYSIVWLRKYAETV